MTVSRTALLSEVERLLTENRISGMPVVDDAGRAIGVISVKDLLERYEEDPDARPRNRPDSYRMVTEELAEEDVDIGFCSRLARWPAYALAMSLVRPSRAPPAYPAARAIRSPTRQTALGRVEAFDALPYRALHFFCAQVALALAEMFPFSCGTSLSVHLRPNGWRAV